MNTNTYRRSRPSLLFGAALLLMQPQVARAQSRRFIGNWTIGYSFGELPVPKSLKKDLALGYHIDDRAWIGFGYEAGGERRKTTLFNAADTGVQRATRDVEHMGRKAYVMARIRLHPRMPFAMLGAIVSDRSTETVFFGSSPVTVAGSAESVGMRKSQAANIRPAVGIGYRLSFRLGVKGFVEWSRWWLRPAPGAIVATYDASAPAGAAPTALRATITARRVETYQALRFGLAYSM